jgi:hypothetical protein
MIKLLVPGEWWLYSDSDRRWNVSGKADVGGFVMPKECEEKIKELEKIYGPKPSDLTWNYMKD